MLRFLIQMFLLCFFLSGWGVAAAAKMYKWVDANGETHFSQTPPIQEETPVAQDQVQVHTTSASVLVPTTVEGELYCGELKLPTASGKRRLSVKTLNDKVKYWSQTLERSKQALDRYLAPKRKYYSSSYRNKSSTFNEELARYQKPVNEYQCAIDWANSKKESARESEAEYMKERNKAQKDLDVATAQMHRLCGEEPEKYNEYGKKRERYLAWRKCTRKYGAVVREMQNKLNSVKRSYY
ncbi:MAG: DUF4124 domain-containing protein [Sedimenticola sp.]|nr:DUF4124 domain-containing protein [Sedimenticola sp.]